MVGDLWGRLTSVSINVWVFKLRMVDICKINQTLSSDRIEHTYQNWGSSTTKIINDCGHSGTIYDSM